MFVKIPAAENNQADNSIMSLKILSQAEVPDDARVKKKKIDFNEIILAFILARF